MKYIKVILILMLVSACKNDKDVSKEAEETIVETMKSDSEKKIVIEVTLKTDQDGLFYTNFVNAGPNNKSVVKYQKLTSSNEFQKFRGELDLTINQVPERIILYLGQETPKTINIKEVVLSSGNVEIKGSDISKYFVPNSFVEYFKGTDSIKTIKVDNRHIPTLTLNTKTLDSLLY